MTQGLHKDITYYLEDEARLLKLPYELLNQWSEESPGSFLLQYAIARKYFLETHKIPSSLLHSVAALSPDRKKLAYILYRPIEMPRTLVSSLSPTEKTTLSPPQNHSSLSSSEEKTPSTQTASSQNNSTTPMNESDPTQKTNNAALSEETTGPLSKLSESPDSVKEPYSKSANAADAPKAAHAKPAKQPVPKKHTAPVVSKKRKPREPQSFTDWLKMLNAQKPQKASKQKKTITASKVRPIKTKKRLSRALKKIKTVSADPVSETYADLLAAQGHTKKAIEIYEKLIALYPEKKATFAQKLENLKK